jgi:hypothetical protein
LENATVDDSRNTDLGLTPSTDLFMKATESYLQRNYPMAERLFRNLLNVLRNAVRDHKKLVHLLSIDFDSVKHLVIDDMNDINSYTGTLHNLASICAFLNKLNDAEFFI